jgi:DsbC/DsbD-like thiol-disulfide interchange protein
MFRRFLDLLTFILVAAWSLADARALESPWVDALQAQVRLLAAGPQAGAGAPRGGIEIRLAPGWHTYWRYPGDAGVPPRFDWSGSENLAAVEVRYPAPRRIVEAYGTKVIGYLDNVIFPLHIRPSDPARPVKLQLLFDFAVCEKLCVPAQTRLAIEIPAGGGGASSALDAAEARVPRRVRLGEGGSLAIRRVSLERGSAPRALVEVAVPPQRTVDLFAEGPTNAWTLPLPEPIKPANGPARFSVVIDGAPPGANPIPPKLILTLVAGSDAIEVEAPLD